MHWQTNSSYDRDMWWQTIALAFPQMISCASFESRMHGLSFFSPSETDPTASYLSSAGISRRRPRRAAGCAGRKGKQLGVAAGREGGREGGWPWPCLTKINKGRIEEEERGEGRLWLWIILYSSFLGRKSLFFYRTQHPPKGRGELSRIACINSCHELTTFHKTFTARLHDSRPSVICPH